MSDEIEVEVIAKRAVSIASKQSFALGNSGNNNIGIPITLVGPLFWCCIMMFSFTKMPILLFVLTTIAETVIGYGMKIRGGIVGMIRIMKYNTFSSKRKSVRN